jgi:hypothetical protein
MHLSFAVGEYVLVRIFLNSSRFRTFNGKDEDDLHTRFKVGLSLSVLAIDRYVLRSTCSPAIGSLLPDRIKRLFQDNNVLDEFNLGMSISNFLDLVTLIRRWRKDELVEIAVEGKAFGVQKIMGDERSALYLFAAGCRVCAAENSDLPPASLYQLWTQQDL